MRDPLRVCAALAVGLGLSGGCASRPPAPPASPARPAADRPDTARVTLVFMNDVYQISPVDKGAHGGLARVAGLVRKIEADSPHTLFLLAGDFLSPSIVSRRYKGAQMVDILNRAGLDVTTLGNHEFDFGLDVLAERVRESHFAYTVANVVDGATGQPVAGARRSVLIDLGPVKVGVVGLMLAETSTLSYSMEGVRFDDPVATGRAVAAELRKQGADFVVALTHQAMAADKHLALVADVDLVVGGHDHEQLAALAGRAPILKMGSDGRLLGRVDVSFVRRRSGGYAVQGMDWWPIPITAEFPEAPDVAAAVRGYEQEMDRSLGEVLGRSTVDLDARAATLRERESNLGSFVADTYREAMEADVAILNGGGLRSDAVYEAGDITKRDVLSILPFENPVCKVKIDGGHLRRLLENGVSVLGEQDGRFPQVSGMTVVFDPARPPGARVVSVAVGGTPLREDAAYTVATTRYVLNGGDGYDFKGAEVLVGPQDGPVEPDVLMEAIRKLGTIDPAADGRIRATTD